MLRPVLLGLNDCLAALKAGRATHSDGLDEHSIHTGRENRLEPVCATLSSFLTFSRSVSAAAIPLARARDRLLLPGGLSRCVCYGDSTRRAQWSPCSLRCLVLSLLGGFDSLLCAPVSCFMLFSRPVSAAAIQRAPISALKQTRQLKCIFQTGTNAGKLSDFQRGKPASKTKMRWTSNSFKEAFQCKNFIFYFNLENNLFCK